MIMKMLFMIGAWGVMLTYLGADTVKWTARGEVTGVVMNGDGGFVPLGIGAGDAVAVEFQYDDAAGGVGIRDFSGFGWFSEYDYRTNIDLAIRVEIGAHVWRGEVVTAGGGSPYTVFVKDVIGEVDETELLALTVSDEVGEGGVFGSFPGSVSTGDRVMWVEMHDTVFPFGFLMSNFPPQATEPTLDELTAAGGEIRSGSESIAFMIDPASIVVADGPIGKAMAAAIAVGGGEVNLAWEAEMGAGYAVRWSENGRQWGMLNTLTADAVDEIFTFMPFGAPAAQYYFVSRDD